MFLYLREDFKFKIGKDQRIVSFQINILDKCRNENVKRINGSNKIGWINLIMMMIMCCHFGMNEEAKTIDRQSINDETI
ncbi:hypothetical protein DERP_005869 [Dermatophagoides pteronyssinus]|uniref:Uncharacterized protein n=1 Tax=Dermatophagoides pteronyssinus TaxID=6956 RepID=A0ABQ8JAE0_DERPT|nr:hypothetical protein DERP_005869 [Dermatophagoides pteronyssinus]